MFFHDEFVAVSYRWRKFVISHGSALYLAGLSDRMSYASDVTVLHGYNPRGLTREHPDARLTGSIPTSTSWALPR